MPNDLRFGAIRHGLTVSAGTRPALHHGELTNTLSRPEQTVRITIGGRALKVRKARGKRTLVVIATDTTGTTTRLVYRARDAPETPYWHSANFC